MTSEEILTGIIEKGHIFYKKNFRKYCPTIARMLDRKEPITLNNQEYKCWSELVVHNIAKLIQEYLPKAQCKVVLDMNDSQLIIDDLTEEDEKIIMTQLQKMVQEEK